MGKTLYIRKERENNNDFLYVPRTGNHVWMSNKRQPRFEHCQGAYSNLVFQNVSEFYIYI